MKISLDPLLRGAALAQLAIAILNFFLIRIMNWKPDLERAPLLIREVFRIHVFFISIILTIFAALTWRFAKEIATAPNPVFIWIAAGIGIFWAVRSVMQWSHYSASHWHGDAVRTAIHWMLFLGYGAMAAVYFSAAFWRNAVKIVSRIALGIVWVYEGLVPKILFLREDEIDLVRRTNLVWRTPEFTLLVMGIAQVGIGIWLVAGFAERAAVAVATLWMSILLVLVASGNPWMLTDPYGALIKDVCLVACAVTVWMLAPEKLGRREKLL